MKNLCALIIDGSSGLIKFVEQIPDPVIALLNGGKILAGNSDLAGRAMNRRVDIVMRRKHARS